MRNEQRLTAALAAAILALPFVMSAQTLAGKKALYINSYHEGYSWSDGIEKTIKGALAAAGVEIKVARMDTYRQKSAEHLAKISQDIKTTIEERKPDVVSGSWHDYLNGLSLVGFNKLASEQGEWAAEAAIKILKGTSAADIPVTTNKKGELVINTRISKKVGVSPSFEMLQSAKVIE